MSEIVSCANHTCNAQFCKASDEYITCSLCLQPAYCSDECRLLDWRAHSCPNVHETKNISAGLAVPYYYEDMLTQEELSDVPINDPIFQSYQVLCCNANRTIQQDVVPSLIEFNAKSKDDETPIARGKNPEAWNGIKDYTLRIVIGGKTYDIVGQIPRDMIYKENATNEKARAISGGGADFKDRVKNIFKGGARRAFRHAETSFIFWPSTQKVINSFIEVDFAGDIEVWLLIKKSTGAEEKISNVIAGYDLPSPGRNDVSAAARKVQQMFRSQIELKFQGIDDVSTKNLYVRRYSDFEGNGIVLTFQITPGTRKGAQLVDLEYVVNANRVKKSVFMNKFDMGSMSDKEKALSNTFGENTNILLKDDDNLNSLIESKYACNVRDFEEMVGLSMAIDTYIASPSSLASSATLRDLDNKSAIIKEYVHTMQTNNGQAPESIPPEVDTAIMVAMNVMYQPIEMSQKQWDNKAISFDNFQMEVNRVIERVRELRAKTQAVNTTKLTGKMRRGVTTLFQKKPLLADLDRILKAIDKRTINFEREGVNAETIQKWSNLKKRVSDARYNVETPPPVPARDDN